MAQLKDTIVNGSLTVADATAITGPAQISAGDLTLYTAGTGNSPGIIFQRGALNDNYNDWQIQDRGGMLYFDQRGNGSTAFGQVISLATNGDITTQKSASAYKGTYTTAALTAARTWTFPDKTGTVALMSDIGSLGGGTITKVKTTAGAHTTIDVSSGDAEFNVPTHTSHLTNDSGFVSSLIGSTSTLTPTQVLTALQAGKTVYITHTHELYGNIVATYFDYSNTFSVIISNIITLYTNEFNQTVYMLFQLSGYLSNNTWGVHVTTLAEKTDIPNLATNNTTGILIADHGTTSVGSASGWNAGSASVSNHVLSFTAPTLTITSTPVTTGTTHSITDNGHTHSLTY